MAVVGILGNRAANYVALIFNSIKYGKDSNGSRIWWITSYERGRV